MSKRTQGEELGPPEQSYCKIYTMKQFAYLKTAAHVLLVQLNV